MRGGRGARSCSESRWVTSCTLGLPRSSSEHKLLSRLVHIHSPDDNARACCGLPQGLSLDDSFGVAEVAGAYIFELIDLGKFHVEVKEEVIVQVPEGVQVKLAPPALPEDFVAYRDLPTELALLELRIATMLPDVMACAIEDGVVVPEIEDATTLLPYRWAPTSLHASLSLSFRPSIVTVLPSGALQGEALGGVLGVVRQGGGPVREQVVRGESRAAALSKAPLLPACLSESSCC
jgi:hypothetical protein